MRKKVTKNDVSIAVDQLLSDGKPVTYRSIVDIAGGSNSTVGPLISECLSEKGLPTPQPKKKTHAKSAHKATRESKACAQAAAERQEFLKMLLDLSEERDADVAHLRMQISKWTMLCERQQEQIAVLNQELIECWKMILRLRSNPPNSRPPAGPESPAV